MFLMIFGYGPQKFLEVLISLSAVQLLLQRNADVNAKDEWGQTALHRAAKSGNRNTIQLLLEHNADVNAKDDSLGRTALHRAAMTGNHDTVKLLLEYNADINAYDEWGWTALHQAAENGNRDIVQLLLKYNADINTKDNDGRTAMHQAARHSNHDTVQLLLKHNADVNAEDIHIRSVLYTAASNSDLTLVQRFLQNTVNIDAKCKQDVNGGTLLMSYVLRKIDQVSVDILRLFEEFGADFCTRTKERETLTHVLLKHLASSENVTEPLMKVVMFLLDDKFENDLSVKCKDNSGNSPLHFWSQLTNGNTTESFVSTVGATLLSRGSPVNTKNDSDETSFHLSRSWCAVELLLENGAARNVQNASGNTPLLARVKRLESCSSFLYDPTNSKETADKQFKTLFQTGVDPWIENKNGESVFSVLVEKDNIELAQSFVEAYAALDVTKLNCQNSHGETPLHLACKSTNLESYSLINMLLSITADPTKTNGIKETPLHVACKKALDGGTSRQLHIWVAGALMDYGASTRIEDADGRTCLNLSEADDELKGVLLKTGTTTKPSQFLRWCKASQKHSSKLSQVSCGQKYHTVDTYYYHQDAIGSGAFSQVYAGIRKKDGLEIALKRVDTMKLKRREDHREISNLVKLSSCDRVVRYIDFVEEKHASFIVLELIEGTLDDYLNIKSDPTHDVLLCNDVIRGLDFLHRHVPPVLHRDIKPGNVLYKILDRPCLKIADFGLSTKADPNASESTVGTGSAFAGTRSWMAPEILDGKEKPSKTSDVFASGLVLHVILANGRHPFAPENTTGMSKDRLKIETEGNLIKYTFAIDDGLSQEAQDLVGLMLDSDVSKRPHTAAVLTHPFFWSSKKKLDFLNAVGNLPPIETPAKFIPNPIADDLENGLGKQFCTNPWDGPILEYQRAEDTRHRLLFHCYDLYETRLLMCRTVTTPRE